MKRFLFAAALAASAASAPAAVEPKPTVITADRLDAQSTGAETVSVFDGHVHVDATNLKLDCDHLRVISSRVGEPGAAIGQPTGLKSLVATGHVRISQVGGARDATCGEADLIPDKDEIVLRDRPVVNDHVDNTTVSGSWVELFRGREKVIVHGASVVGPPMRDLGFEKKPTPAPAKP